MDKTVCCHPKSYWNGKHLLLGLVFWLFIQGCYAKQPVIRVLFVGDILLSRNVRSEIQTRNTSPWEVLQPFFKSASLVIGNLEGAVGKREDQFLSKSDSPVFAIDSADIRLLGDAGFNTITLGNNHRLDLGEIGRQKTINALQNCGITPVTPENSPQFFTVKNLVIAVVTINMIPGRDFSKDQVPSVGLKQKLRLAQSLSNLVVVSIHWGSELLSWPNRSQREAATWLVGNGADIIIGHHPHVIQKPEMINGKPVFFSLGNHLFDQKYPETKTGLIVEMLIQNGKAQCRGILTHTQQNSFYPEIIKNQDFKLNAIELRNNALEINGYQLRPKSVSETGQPKIILEAFQNGEKQWKTPPMSLVMIGSGKLDDRRDYLFTLENHYSSLDKENSLRPYVYDIDRKGLFAKWRGSALAWPLLDALLLPANPTIVCALHRGDSFINPDKSATNNRVAAYRWNGFGFKGVSDSTTCESCRKLLIKE